MRASVHRDGEGRLASRWPDTPEQGKKAMTGHSHLPGCLAVAGFSHFTSDTDEAKGWHTEHLEPRNLIKRLET